MTDKVLKKLSRKELLEILVEQSKENDKLRAQLKEAQDKLNDRNIMLKEAGTLAEASVRINRVFESAETAAQQYLDNAQRMSREAEELLDRTRQRCAKIIEAARENAKKIESEGNG